MSESETSAAKASGIVRIAAADRVYAAGDEERAEQLADIRAEAASAWLGARHPEAEICADVAIYPGRGTQPPPEVAAYDAEGRLNEAVSRELQAGLAEHLARAVQDAGPHSGHSGESA